MRDFQKTGLSIKKVVTTEMSAKTEIKGIRAITKKELVFQPSRTREEKSYQDLLPQEQKSN
jgi:hypothetical protein